MKISVFGSAQPLHSEPLYQEAFELGVLLGRASCTVLTGGYMGAMEAISKGAAGEGAHVIGVTCEEIERWRPNGANPWVKEEWRTKTIFERIERMLRNSDAAIALPGGIGTLTEIMVTWNHLAIEAWSGPLVLMESGWQNVLTVFMEQGTISAIDRRRVRFVHSVEEAAASVVGQLSGLAAKPKARPLRSRNICG